MTHSNTNYRTALVAPTPSDSIREAHSYEYDNNGNILYVNTLRLKPDMTAQPDTVQRTRDKRTVPLAHERKGARRASEAQQSKKTLTVTLSRITNAYTQSCWIANPAERGFVTMSMFRSIFLLFLIVLISCLDNRTREVNDVLCKSNNHWFLYSLGSEGTNSQRVFVDDGLRFSFTNSFTVVQDCNYYTYKVVPWSFRQGVLNVYYSDYYVHKVDNDTIWLVDTLFNMPFVLVNRGFKSNINCYDTVMMQWRNLPYKKDIIYIPDNGLIE